MKAKIPYCIYRGIIVLSLLSLISCVPAKTTTPTITPIPPTQEVIIPTATSTASPTTIPPLPFVKVNYPGLSVDGKPFRFIGANSIYFGYYGEFGYSIEDAIRAAKENGINVLRIYLGFGNDTWGGKPFEKFDQVLDIAAKNRVYVIATLTDCCCFGGNWGKTEDAYFQKVPYCNVSSKPGLTSFKEYIKSVLLRKNTINGKIYKDDTTILGWDVANEQPLQLFSDSDFSTWLNDVTAYIKSVDPNHLITIGIDASSDIYNSSGPRYDALNVPGLDFYSFHFNLPSYLDVAGKLESLQYRVETLLSMGKPVVMEEFGIGTERSVPGMNVKTEEAWLKGYRDQMDTAFSSGVSGVMFWGWGVPETTNVPLWWNAEDHNITETNFVKMIKEYQIPPAEFSPNPLELIDTPEPAATSVQPVYVKAFCTLIGQDKTTRVPVGTPVIITWGWNAKTESQINDFLANNITTVTLDGKVIKGTQTGGIIKVQARNDLEVVWVSEVGILDPGQHTIIYDQKFKKKIEDGSSAYGPGTANETEHDECLIVVE